MYDQEGLGLVDVCSWVSGSVSGAGGYFDLRTITADTTASHEGMVQNVFRATSETAASSILFPSQRFKD